MDRTRTSGIYDASQWGVTLIGLGGIGAITAVTLAKMGFRSIKGFDPDEVSDENTGTQLYGPNQVGMDKWASLYYPFAFYAPDVIFSGFGDRVWPDTPWETLQAPIIISGVDSIASRQDIWAAISDKPFMWYIDARMAAEELVVYVVDGDDREWYDRFLSGQSDDQIADLPCTSKATFYCGMAAAATIGSICRKIITNCHLNHIYALNLFDWGAVSV